MINSFCNFDNLLVYIVFVIFFYLHASVVLSIVATYSLRNDKNDGTHIRNSWQQFIKGDEPRNHTLAVN